MRTSDVENLIKKHPILKGLLEPVKMKFFSMIVSHGSITASNLIKEVIGKPMSSSHKRVYLKRHLVDPLKDIIQVKPSKTNRKFRLRGRPQNEYSLNFHNFGKIIMDFWNLNFNKFDIEFLENLYNLKPIKNFLNPKRTLKGKLYIRYKTGKEIREEIKFSFFDLFEEKELVKDKIKYKKEYYLKYLHWFLELPLSFSCLAFHRVSNKTFRYPIVFKKEIGEKIEREFKIKNREYHIPIGLFPYTIVGLFKKFYTSLTKEEKKKLQSIGEHFLTKKILKKKIKQMKKLMEDVIKEEIYQST